MSSIKHSQVRVPFFRPSIGDAEVDEVVECLRSGWLTTGPRTKQFEEDFAKAVGAQYAVAVNSCTAALHLAVEALELHAGQAVLIPTMTFAATAEIIRYQGAIPILVDCEPSSLNIDLRDAERKLLQLRAGRLPIPAEVEVVGIIPVHVGGAMVDMEGVADFAKSHRLWVVEDSAHALPAEFKATDGRWRKSGQSTAAVTCFSFYANKTITTGEGGMAVTDDESLARRMRQMSLHGLSNDAWKRFSGTGAWDYRILAPGYKYNLTDLASSLGIHQLARAEELRAERQQLAERFLSELASVAELELPNVPADRLHSWHLFPIRLRLDRLNIDRNEFMERMRERGVSNSVHWRPLHLHPYYEQQFLWRAEDFPVASREWERLVSLPLFPGMTEAEVAEVIRCVQELCCESQAIS